MKRKLSWKGFSSDDRNKSITFVKDAISSNDGCITNFTMFSDLALSMQVEIEESKIAGLYEELTSKLEVSQFDEELNPLSKREWMVYLNISFGDGQGNLKVSIPEVPG
ncbi:MAG: hypothetical protein JXQ96_19770 [Cyclobacteriaceae bacterium]